jgi:hypothetical protein
MKLPAVKLVSSGPGKGTLTINGFPIPGLEEVKFYCGAGQPSICKIKIVCEGIEVDAPVEEIEMTASPWSGKVSTAVPEKGET